MTHQLKGFRKKRYEGRVWKHTYVHKILRMHEWIMQIHRHIKSIDERNLIASVQLRKPRNYHKAYKT